MSRRGRLRASAAPNCTIFWSGGSSGISSFFFIFDMSSISFSRFLSQSTLESCFLSPIQVQKTLYTICYLEISKELFSKCVFFCPSNRHIVKTFPAIALKLCTVVLHTLCSRTSLLFFWISYIHFFFFYKFLKCHFFHISLSVLCTIFNQVLQTVFIALHVSSKKQRYSLYNSIKCTPRMFQCFAVRSW